MDPRHLVDGQPQLESKKRKEFFSRQFISKLTKKNARDPLPASYPHDLFCYDSNQGPEGH